MEKNKKARKKFLKSIIIVLNNHCASSDLKYSGPTNSIKLGL